MTSFRRFIPDTDEREEELSLAVVNRDAPEPLQALLEKMFDRQSVTVDEIERDAEEQDMVYLIDGDDVTASSPLREVANAILLVNSDLYTTGTRSVDEVDPPAVINGLTDVPFRLRGYPESNKEKLLLITISRYIERLSLEHDGGKHRASFQRLSRVEGEQGTKTVYERLANVDTDVHAYGIPDWTPQPYLDLTIHGGWEADFRDTWFVVHVPDDTSSRHAALVAIQPEPGSWDGIWTYDENRVREINRHIEQKL